MIPSRPRLALRRKVLLALIATIALALSCVGMQTASASTKSRLALSVNPDRSNAVRLNGSTVKGEIYVFVRDSKNLDTVDFYLDGRRRTERVEPKLIHLSTSRVPLTTARRFRTTLRSLPTDRTALESC